MSITATIASCLAEHGITPDLVAHPKSYTSRESAQAAHVPEDHIAKAVIVKDAQGYAMVVIPGSGWLKVGALQAEADRDFVLADEIEVDRLFTDCQPGAVPPLGPAYGLETYVDERLLTLATVYFEAGDHEHLLRVPGASFRDMLRGVRHGYFSHNGE